MKMIRLLIFLIIAILALVSCCKKPQTPEKVIARIPLIDSFKIIKGDTSFSATYEIWFRQPLDHKNTSGYYFPQKVLYAHTGFDRPMVVVIEGYSAGPVKPCEITSLLDANQLIIEHRFFDKSKPRNSIPWKLLNIYQAAADHHQVIQAFKNFYHGKWISTGISKGGQAAIYHRRFYPEDVDVSVPYVAPLNFSSEDPRVYAFLESVGTEDCRNKIYLYQLELFRRKKDIFPMFEKLAKDKGWHFSMGLDRAYDLSVLEYSFAFWQWGNICDSIPRMGSSPKDLFKAFKELNPFTFFEEKDIENQRSFFYQAMTEIGMYGYQVKPFGEFLKDTVNITFDFTMPGKQKAVFNPKVMSDIDSWLKQSGNNILYIYGQNDAWSATAVDPGNKTNAVKMVNPGGSHKTRIRSFPIEMQDSIYKVLGKWTGIDLSAKMHQKQSDSTK